MPAPAAVMLQSLFQNLPDLITVAAPVLPVMLGRVVSEDVGFTEFDVRNIDFSIKWIHIEFHLFYQNITEIIHHSRMLVN